MRSRSTMTVSCLVLAACSGTAESPDGTSAETASSAEECAGPSDPVAMAERAETILLVRGAPLTTAATDASGGADEAFERAREKALENRATTYEERSAGLGDDTTLAFTVMEVVTGRSPDTIVMDTAPLGCASPRVGKSYLLMLGPGDSAALAPVDGTDDPTLREVRLTVR